MNETLKDTQHFVICDTQKEYSESLLKFLSEHLTDEYQFHLFHDIQNLYNFSTDKSIQILLIGEEYSPDNRYQIHASTRFLLTGCKVSGTSTARASPLSEYPLFRYQAANRLLSEMQEILLLEKQNKGTSSHQKSSDSQMIPPLREAEKARSQQPKVILDSSIHGIIGIYSPVHRIGKTRFALRLGKQLSETMPVLYLNLEDYCGNPDLFPAKNGQTLEDLLYYMRQDNMNLGLKLSTMIGQLENLDYLSPIRRHQDLCSVSCNEWLELFRMLLEKSIYQVLILDLGDCINGLYEILKSCVKVYTPYIEDSTAKAKLAQYEEDLRSSGYNEVLKHTIRRRIKSIRKHTQKSEVHMNE